RGPMSGTAARSSAPRACWRCMPLTSPTETTFDRLRDDVDVLEWHVGIERQRDGAIADPFGNREIARLIAVAFGKVRHQMNGAIVDHGTNAFRVQIREQVVPRAAVAPNGVDMTSVNAIGAGAGHPNSVHVREGAVVALGQRMAAHELGVHAFKL